MLLNKHLPKKYTKNTLFGLSIEAFRGWGLIAVTYNRIPFGEDNINFESNNGVITFKYANHQSFDWRFKVGSTYSKLIYKYGLNLSIKHEEVKSVLTVKSKNIKSDILYTELKLCTLCADGRAYIDGFRNLKKYTEKIDCDSSTREIIFETILNVVQHEYRGHGHIKANDANDFIRKYFDKYPSEYSEMSDSIILYRDVETKHILEQMEKYGVNHVYALCKLPKERIEKLKTDLGSMFYNWD